MAGSGSGEDPEEASELQPDSTGGSVNSCEPAKKRPRKEVRSDEAGELDHAFASEQETFRAIRDVLERRQIYLQSKGIKNLGHKMGEDQRAEFCKEVREEYENLEDQQTRQANDKDVNYAAYVVKVRQQWVEWARDGKGRGAHEPVMVSRDAFVRKQGRHNTRDMERPKKSAGA